VILGLRYSSERAQGERGGGRRRRGTFAKNARLPFTLVFLAGIPDTDERLSCGKVASGALLVPLDSYDER
jgi:hypothetical protein